MSTDAQLAGDSLRRQSEQSTRYAEQNGLTLVEDFRLEDIGVSAFKGANVQSGALRRFLEAVRSGNVPPGSYLLIESLDRLSRQEVMKSLSVFTDLLNSGITIVTLADGMEYPAGQTDFAQLIYSISVMSRAHDESRMKSHRGLAVWERKRAQIASEKLTARCPAWLRLAPDRKSFEVIEGRAQIVQSIFQDSADGIGSYSIARRLNKEGVPPFGRSKGWQISYILKILRGRAVIGEYVPGRLVSGRKTFDQSPVPDYYPPVVDEDLFYRAQAALKQRFIAGRGRKGEFVSNLFSGLAQCGYCRSKMHFINKGTGPKGGTYLVCDSAQRGLGCERALWRYDNFEAAFLGFVQELNLKPLVTRAEGAEEREELEAGIESIRGRVTELEQRRERVFELVLDPSTASEFVRARLRDCERELQLLQDDLQLKLEKRAALQSEAARFYEGKEQIKSLIARLQRRDDDSAFRLRSQIAARLKALVGTIYVSPGKTRVRPQLADLGDQQHQVRPYFMIVFKDGSLRIVFPNKDDPFRYDEVYQRTATGADFVAVRGDAAMLRAQLGLALPPELTDSAGS